MTEEQNTGPTSLALVRDVIQLLKNPEVFESEPSNGQYAFLVLADTDPDKEMTFLTFAGNAKLLVCSRYLYDIIPSIELIGRVAWIVLVSKPPVSNFEQTTKEVDAVHAFIHLFKTSNDVFKVDKLKDMALSLTFIGLLKFLGLPATEPEFFNVKIHDQLFELYRTGEVPEDATNTNTATANLFSQAGVADRIETTYEALKALAGTLDIKSYLRSPVRPGGLFPSRHEVLGVHRSNHLPESTLRLEILKPRPKGDDLHLGTHWPGDEDKKLD